MENQIMGNEYRTSVICIDSYTDGVPAGCVSNPAYGTKSFGNLTQLLLGIEDMLNEIKCPQAFTTLRKFSEAQLPPIGPVEGTVQTGRLATFAVRILFRRNASWQGSICWLEGNREESFRSVLELIQLMDSALRTV